MTYGFSVLGGIRLANLLIRRRRRGVYVVVPNHVTAGQKGCAVPRVVGNTGL